MATDYTDKIGQRLDDPASVPPEYAHLVPDDVQRVTRILGFPAHGYVLDVGCSDGAITRRIVEEWGVCALGADVRPDIYGVPWDCRQPWPYAVKFDVAYACEVFEHLTDADAQRALTNILAVLKPGGDLIVTVPNRYPHDNYVVQARDRWRWPDHRSSWTLAKLDLFLQPHFAGMLEWVPLYEGEAVADSIWLIVRATGKR